MAQGLIGGATSYEEQSLQDILEDVNEWIKYTQEISLEINKGITKLKESNFWNKVYFNFQLTLLSSLTCQKAYLHDFLIIVKAIQEDKITEREVKLLRHIGKKAIEFNHEYGRTFKEEYSWRDYGNPDFTVAEDLYAHGRDYFVTLQDATNASARLNDYINMLPSVTNNNITQNIHGSRNIITGINYDEVTYNEINSDIFSEEISQAINKIRALENYDDKERNFLVNSLREALEAIKNEDIEKQNLSKVSFKSFLTGLGKNADKIINILASLTNIASFFGINITQ